MIYQNGDYNSKYVTSVDGYIPYTKMIPKSKLVIFTGSACLLNTCYLYKTPMYFVPVLAEQYFWAKNYHYFTGTSFDTIEFEASQRTKDYLNKVSASMKTYDAARNLLGVINGT